MEKLISGYFHPTKVILVDDNVRFLDNLCLKLDDRVNYDTFADPIQALEHINKPKTLENEEDFLTNTEDESFNNRSIKVDIKSIQRQMLNPERFEKVTVVVVDYAMPSISGLKFCEKLEDKTIKRIMLTGEADQHLAVKAFNEGLIDRFLLKSSPDYLKELMSGIEELQNQYFLEKTEIITKSLNSQTYQCLRDSSFQEFFWDICQREDIVEYYLSDDTGSFILIDFEGNLKILAISNDEEIAALYDIAVDDLSNEEVIQGLNNRKSLIYFHSDKDRCKNAKKWNKFTYKASPISGKKGYYYSLINETKSIFRKSEPIKPFSQHLDTVI